MEDVITRGGVELMNSKCRCAECGKVAVCTPTHAFFTEPHNDHGPLFCKRCLMTRCLRYDAKTKILQN